MLRLVGIKQVIDGIEYGKQFLNTLPTAQFRELILDNPPLIDSMHASKLHTRDFHRYTPRIKSIALVLGRK